MQHDRLYLTAPPAATASEETGPASQPDSVLLERVAAGEKQALAALFRRHSPHLYTVALKILSDPVEAAAVVRAVALDVLYETRRFSPAQYPVRRWLVDVTRLTALDHLRARTQSSAA
jgi:RNA polymerase sigma-70 factor (ECF subfamily)